MIRALLLYSSYRETPALYRGFLFDRFQTVIRPSRSTFLPLRGRFRASRAEVAVHVALELLKRVQLDFRRRGKHALGESGASAEDGEGLDDLRVGSHLIAERRCDDGFEVATKAVG